MAPRPTRAARRRRAGTLVAGIVWAGSRLLDRDRSATHASFGSLAIVSIAGVICHVLMDLPTSLRHALRSPFDWSWYAVDLMPIIDIYLPAALAACFWSGSRLEWRRRNVVIALTMMALNYGVRIAAHRQALETAPRTFGPTLPERCASARPQGPFVDHRPIHGPLSDDGGPVPPRDRRTADVHLPFQWRLAAQLSNAYETRDVDLIDLALRPPPATPEAPWRLATHSKSLDAGGTPGGPLGDRPIFLGSRFPAAQATADSEGDAIVRWTDVPFTAAAPRTPVDGARAGFSARRWSSHRMAASWMSVLAPIFDYAQARAFDSAQARALDWARTCRSRAACRAPSNAAVAHGCEAMQIFTKNASQWRGRVIPPDEIRVFRSPGTDRHRARGVARQLSDQPGDDDRALRAQSIAAMGDEIDRAEALGLLGVVLHPGCYTDGSEAHGLALIAEALDELLRERRRGGRW